MKNKKTLFLLISVLLIILLSLFFIIKHYISTSNTDNYSEYTPQEEINLSQLRQTTINLYFLDSNGNLKIESKQIDSVELLQNPYKRIIEILLEGPKNQDLHSPFPENTKILDSGIENNCVTLDFSNELLDFKDDTQKQNIINSILNTLKQLNEVNSFKIIINNLPSEIFDEIWEI